MTKKIANQPTLSIIVTAHHEGLLAHKTMRSIERAARKLDDAKIGYEVIISIDRGNAETINYFKEYNELPIAVHNWDHGDLGKSRNSAITKASGRFVACIDADDLMSESWLHDGITTLLQHPYGTHVAHSEYTIEFEGTDAIVRKAGHTNKEQDTLLSVFSGRWNSVIIAPITLLQENPYAPNSPGFGYEDWHLSCSFIQKDVKNILIPKTAIFVRRKAAGSEWARQKSNRSLLHAHEIFTPSHFRTIDIKQIPIPTTEQYRQTKNTIKELIIRSRIPLGLVKKPLAIARRGKQALQRKTQSQQAAAPTLPKWLDTEWRALHIIEKLIFPPSPLPQVYYTITDDHYRVGLAYWEMCRELQYDTYDYVLFVPWLKRGGADLFALNYANTAAQLGARVLVIATNEAVTDYSEWSERLDTKVDFLQFGAITRFFTVDQKYRLLEQLIENIHVDTLHILNSALAYDFVRDHEAYITATNKRIIATAYSQSTNETGRIFGFSHSHIPQVYHLLSLITTDNAAVRAMWVDEYAYNPKKIVIHHQPLADTAAYPSTNAPANTNRVLWASRLSPEKAPHLIAKIAALLPEVEIDVYGEPSPEFTAAQIGSHSRVHYKGAFNGVASLPVQQYDAFLYTSLFDGMPNTPLEIALCGLPIAAARVGGLADVIGGHSKIVDNITDPRAYAAALKSILSDKKTAFAQAKTLQKNITTTFSQKSFTEEVKKMLRF